MRYLTLIMLVFSTTLSASTYYVANSSSVNGKYYVSGANNSNNGTSVSTPWRTLGYATSQLGAGDTLFIMGGWWQERNAITGTIEMSAPNHSCIFMSTSGTYGNEIVFKSYIGGGSTERAVITGQDPNNGNNEIMTGFAAERQSHIVIDSLIFQDCGKGGVLIYGCDSIFVKNCEIHDIYTLPGSFDELNTGGIYFNASTIDNPTLYPNRWCEFTNNVIYNIRNASGSIGEHDNCNALHGRGLKYSLISNNTLSGAYFGIRLKTDNDYNIIENNRSFNHTTGGIALASGAQHNIVRYNLVWGSQNGFQFLHASSDDSDPTDSNYIYNNTFMGSGAGGAGLGLGDFESDNTIARNFLFNNILYKWPSNSNGNELYYKRNYPQEYLDYNCYFQNSPGESVINAAYSGGGGNQSLASWQAEALSNFGVAYDQNSVNLNPQFLNTNNSSNANFLRLDTLNSPAALLSGGRGGSWPTYMGAFDPDVVVPVDTNCSDVVLVGPPNDTIFRVTSDQTNLVKLTWRSLVGTGYHLQIADNSGFNSPTIDTIITDTIFLAGGYGAAHLADSTGTTHYWQVQVLSGDCDENYPASAQRFILVDETSPGW